MGWAPWFGGFSCSASAVICASGVRLMVIGPPPRALRNRVLRLDVDEVGDGHGRVLAAVTRVLAGRARPAPPRRDGLLVVRWSDQAAGATTSTGVFGRSTPLTLRPLVVVTFESVTLVATDAAADLAAGALAAGRSSSCRGPASAVWLPVRFQPLVNLPALLVVWRGGDVDRVGERVRDDPVHRAHVHPGEGLHCTVWVDGLDAGAAAVGERDAVGLVQVLHGLLVGEAECGLHVALADEAGAGGVDVDAGVGRGGGGERGGDRGGGHEAEDDLAHGWVSVSLVALWLSRTARAAPPRSTPGWCARSVRTGHDSIRTDDLGQGNCLPFGVAITQRLRR